MAYLLSGIIGILGGLAGGLLGVGGGVIYVPLLILLRHMNPHAAIGTSIAVIIPTAMAAAFRHHQAGMVDWKTAALVAVFAVIGALVGAAISVKLDVVVLRRIFGVFLLLLSFKMFFPN